MTAGPRFAPWQVWWADFTPQIGREHPGERPAVVVGGPLACGLPNGLVIVVPCTATDRGLPFHPSINLDGRPGVAMCDQVKSVSTTRLMRPHRAKLSADEIKAVKFALRQMIDVI